MNYRSICTMCEHYGVGAAEEDPTLRTCAAFPDGIPDEIIRLGFDHRQPFDGDGGVMFSPKGPVDVARIDEIVQGPPRPPDE